MCMQATVHASGVRDMDKLEYSFINLDDGGKPVLRAVEVPCFKTRTLTEPPVIVGVPILHTLQPTSKLDDLL